MEKANSLIYIHWQKKLPEMPFCISVYLYPLSAYKHVWKSNVDLQWIREIMSSWLSWYIAKFVSEFAHVSISK